jgi:hypothetical protein
MLSNVTIILSEEAFDPHASPQLGVVFLANPPWLLVPLAVIACMARSEHPFIAPTFPVRHPFGPEA